MLVLLLVVAVHPVIVLTPGEPSRAWAAPVTGRPAASVVVISSSRCPKGPIYPSWVYGTDPRRIVRGRFGSAYLMGDTEERRLAVAG